MPPRATENQSFVNEPIGSKVEEMLKKLLTKAESTDVEIKEMWGELSSMIQVVGSHSTFIKYLK